MVRSISGPSFEDHQNAEAPITSGHTVMGHAIPGLWSKNMSCFSSEFQCQGRAMPRSDHMPLSGLGHDSREGKEKKNEKRDQGVFFFH